MLNDFGLFNVSKNDKMLCFGVNCSHANPQLTVQVLELPQLTTRLAGI